MRESRVPIGLRGQQTLRLQRAKTVEHNLETARADFRRVEEFERAGREVAGIRVGFESGFFLRLVDAGKFGKPQKNLPPDFHQRRPGRRREIGGRAQRVRQVRDGFDVGRDVVAFLAIAARDSANEFAVFVRHADRGAVDLGLDGINEVVATKQFGEARVEIAEFALVVGVVEGGHREAMLGAHETVGAVVAHALRRRIGHHQRGVLALEFFQLALERVIFEIADLGPRAVAVKFIVPPDVGGEGRDTLGGGFGRHGRWAELSAGS